MSGLRVPVFFGSILTLVVLVLQNRTPFQLTLLGMQSQPLSLGALVALSVLSGVALGAVLQRTGGQPSSRRSSRSSQPRVTEPYSGPEEFQTFRATPQSEGGDQRDDDDEVEVERPPSESRIKGWDVSGSQSWTEQANQAEQEGRFWSRANEKKSRRGSVTPINSNRNRDKSKTVNQEDSESVMDAEYRIIPPEQPGRDDGFDDDFFDDFFDEDD